MKKLFKGGKTGLSSGKIRAKLALLIILFLISNLSAQVYLNGFCQVEILKTKANYTGIYIIDYNKDSFDDILVYGINDKKIALHAGLKNQSFSAASEKFFYYPITEFKFFNHKKYVGDLYLFISREKRLVGLVSFTKYGTLQLLNQIELDYYPGSISIGDYDKDGINDALISGENFDGLSILKEDKFKLIEEKIYSNRIFSEAKFIDLDYDNFVDIAALDLFENSIVIFNNNRFGEFKKSRSIIFDDKIKNLSATYFNKDDYIDLIISQGNSLNVWYGDSVSSFNEKVVYPLMSYPDKYTIADYNSDGYYDFAWLNKSSGDLKLLLSRFDNSDYEEHLLMNDKDIVNIINWNDDSVLNLLAVHRNGKLSIYNKIGNYSNSFNIAAGSNINFADSFGRIGAKVKGIYFLDATNNTLQIFLNSKNHLFTESYSYALSKNFSNVVHNEYKDSLTIFNCYTENERLIEILKINFNKDSIIREILYTPSQILDLKPVNNNGTENPAINTLLKSGRNLILNKYEEVDNNYTLTYRDTLSNHSLNGIFSNYNFSSVYFWERKKDTLLFNHFEINSEEVVNNRNENILVIPDSVTNISMIPIDKNILINQITTNEQQLLIVYYQGKLDTLNFANQLDVYLNINDKFVKNYYSADKAGLNIYYDNKYKSFYKMDFDKDYSQLSFSKIIDSVESNNYFFMPRNNKEIFVGFTEPNKNIITFKKIQ